MTVDRDKHPWDVRIRLKHQEKSTYLSVYEEATALSQFLFGVDGWLFVLLALAAGWNLLVRISPALETELDWTIAILTLIPSLLFVLYLQFFFFVSAGALYKVQRSVPTTAARILIILAQPHRERITGLSARDIRHLRKIAEAEQNSADWRGSFIGVVVVGLISLAISAFPLVWYLYWNDTPIESGSVSEKVRALLGVGGSSWPDIAGVVILLAIGWTVVRLYVYVWGFYSREVGNRAVLIACEEALGLLEVGDLAEADEFTIEEKIGFAEAFGCRLLPAEKRSLSRPGGMFNHVEPDESRWSFAPAKGYSRIVDSWNGINWMVGRAIAVGMSGYRAVYRVVTWSARWLKRLWR